MAEVIGGHQSQNTIAPYNEMGTCTTDDADIGMHIEWEALGLNSMYLFWCFNYRAHREVSKTALIVRGSLLAPIPNTERSFTLHDLLMQ